MTPEETPATKLPPVSVVMPVHNGRPFIDESIQSILAQRFSDFEFVILDDASTDGSGERLREWAQKDSRIRLSSSQQKLGLSGSSNVVVQKSRAPLIARMDADDVSHPDRLDRQVEVLQRCPEVAAVGTLCDGIDAVGRVIRPRDRWRIVRRSPYIPFPHGSVMFRRKTFEAVGGYREEFSAGEDQDLFFRMTAKGSVVTLSASCLQGVRLRGSLAKALLTKTHPNLALIVFPEIHHSAHHLWHTDESDSHFHAGLNSTHKYSPKPSLREIYQEVDKQIAAIFEIMESDTTTMVFSLHGMRSSAGVPAFLQPLLCESDFARLAEWKVQSWTERAHSLLSAGKRHTPEGVKKLYYKMLPRSATYQFARPTMMPAYDWSHTQAFSLPTDQHGWIRINLQGREAEGVVSYEEYDDTCRQVEDVLRGLTMEDGRRLVRHVTRTAADFEEARSLRLPDIVVHWEDTSFRSPTRIKGSAVEVKVIGRKFTGQHAPDGFCILKGGNDLYENDTLFAKDMHLLMIRLLGRET